MTTYYENKENPPAYAPIATAPAYAPTVMQNNSTVNYGDNKQTEHEVTYIPEAYAPIATAPAYAPTVMQNNSTVNYGDNKQTEHEVTYIPEAYVLGPSSGSASQAPTYYQPVITNPSAPTIPVVTTSTTTSNPPGICLDGGQWGTLQYTGNKTGAFACVGCIFLGLFGLAFLVCPQDEKDAYCVNGRLYDAAGVYISTKATSLFRREGGEYSHGRG